MQRDDDQNRNDIKHQTSKREREREDSLMEEETAAEERETEAEYRLDVGVEVEALAVERFFQAMEDFSMSLSISLERSSVRRSFSSIEGTANQSLSCPA